MPERKKLTREEIANLQLEYQQANESWRHGVHIAWTMGTIFIPISFGILAYAATIGKHYLPLAIASVAILMTWVGMIERIRDFDEIRKLRIFKIEKMLKMDHHRRIYRWDRKLIKSWKKLPFYKKLTNRRFIKYHLTRIHSLKWVLLGVLIGAWVLLGLG